MGNLNSGKSNTFLEIEDLIKKAEEIFILTRKDPSLDSLGASLALFLGLSSLGKKVTAACSKPTTIEFANLIGIDKVVQSLKGRNFIISFDYIEGSIEKISYNIKDDKFNLVIETKAGIPPFSPEKVHYATSGSRPDLIFVLDSPSLEDLGSLYEDEKDFYSDTPIINIDYHPNNISFGTINLVDFSSSSTSELITFLIKEINLALNEDMATNLLAGISAATKNFSEAASANAFEAAAICLRAGGKRFFGSMHNETEKKNIPEEWFKPKIFKSSLNQSSEENLPLP